MAYRRSRNKTFYTLTHDGVRVSSYFFHFVSVSIHCIHNQDWSHIYFILINRFNSSVSVYVTQQKPCSGIRLRAVVERCAKLASSDI